MPSTIIPAIPAIKFDIRGENPANVFQGERINLTDKTCPWVIPNGSPFFGDRNLTRVYDAAGRLLKKDRDYWLEQEFTPFVKMTGRPVVCFIRIEDSIRNANAFITVDYTSIGATWVPRNMLQDWLNLIIVNGRDITWDKVFNVPPTLPPEFHRHSIKTEIGDWYELSFFFNYLAQIANSRPASVENNFDAALDAAFDQLNTFKATQLNRITSHDQNYANPHLAVKSNVQAGNMDNFATATVQEALDGVRSDLLITPQGVQELAANHTLDDSQIMRAGIAPFSYFGGSGYIPPNISGSFEGFGGVDNDCAICLESDGVLVAIRAHDDGRATGLYYTTITNYNDPNPIITFTGYRYQPPVLEAIGYRPTRVMSGSGEDVIMVCQYESANAYIALTNGTLNPAAHNYVKADISQILADMSTGTYWFTDAAQIHHMGKWIYIFQNDPLGSAGPWGGWGKSRVRCYRALTATIQAGQPVVFNRVNVSYLNYFGVQQNNSPYFEPVPRPPFAAPFTNCGPWTFSPYPASPTYGGLFRRMHLFSWPSAINPGSYSFHFLGMAFMNFALGAGNGTQYFWFESGYEFNPDTGVFVQTTAPMNQTIDLSKPHNQVNEPALSNYAPFWLGLWSRGDTPSLKLLSTKEIVGWTKAGASETGFPGSYEYLRFTNDPNVTPDAMLRGSLNAKLPGFVMRLPNVAPVYPALSAGFPSMVSYEPGGELYAARNNTQNKRYWFRKVTGDYAVRPGVTNRLWSPLYSRPISNDIYESNFGLRDGIIRVTGTDAFLTNQGLEMGNIALSMLHYDYTQNLSTGVEPKGYYGGVQPVSAVFKAPAGNNIVASCPRTFTKTFDVANRKVTYAGATFYGFRKDVLDQIRNYIPPAQQVGWEIEINIINAAAGAGFQPFNLMTATLEIRSSVVLGGKTYYSWQAKQLWMVPVIEAPNADHPNVYLIKSFTLIDQTPFIVTQYGSWPVNGVQYEEDWPACPHTTLYYDTVANKLQVALSPYLSAPEESGTPVKQCLRFELNFVTNKIENWRSEFNGWAVYVGWIGQAHAIPRIGFGLIDSQYRQNDTGGAGYILKVPIAGQGDRSYLIASAYPEVGWIIYFQDGIPVMVNGVKYVAKGGSIDLRDVDPAPQNKTFYIYATIQNGEVQYLIATKAMRKSANMMRVATVVTNNLQILSINRFQPFMVGHFMVSQTREGGIIPVSSGLPQDQGTFAFLKQSELLP